MATMHTLDGLRAKAHGRTDEKVAAHFARHPQPETVVEDWHTFLVELDALTEADVHSGAPAESLARSVWAELTYGDGGPFAAFSAWRDLRQLAAKRAANAAMLASTVEVAMWRGDKFGKPTRIPKTEIGAWVKPGHVVVTEQARIEGHSFDRDQGPAFTLRSTALKTERPEGTIVAKRRVRDESGTRVEYLVKTRSPKAEAAWKRTQRIAELETQSRVNADHMTPDQAATLRREIETLKAQR
jgi:hypothetical protein